jgi:hypothetical protein
VGGAEPGARATVLRTRRSERPDRHARRRDSLAYCRSTAATCATRSAARISLSWTSCSATSATDCRRSPNPPSWATALRHSGLERQRSDWQFEQGHLVLVTCHWIAVCGRWFADTYTDGGLSGSPMRPGDGRECDVSMPRCRSKPTANPNATLNSAICKEFPSEASKKPRLFRCGESATDGQSVKRIAAVQILPDAEHDRVYRSHSCAERRCPPDRRQ